MTVRIEGPCPKRAMIFKAELMSAKRREWCHYMEPLCSVSYGPVTESLETLANGGLIYEIKHRIAKQMFVCKRVVSQPCCLLSNY